MLNDFNIASHHDLSGKICLIRVDFNVPLKDSAITDDTRITRIIPGLSRLMTQGARLVLLSHLGRPKGKNVPELSLAPIASYLSKVLGKEVPLISDLLSQGAIDQCQSLHDGDVVLGENLRFWPEEEANDDSFARQLAGLGDVFIQDAFSAAHRAHASTQAITSHLPSYVGDSLASELQALSDVLVAPEKPVVAVVGGAKVSTKLAVLENLVTRTDAIILGGGMANSFLGALGIDMKASLREADLYDVAKKIMAKAESSNCQILLPVDGMAATEFAAGAAHRAIANEAMADGEMMLDIGPASITQAQEMIRNATTVLWNGPMGAFEMAPFDTATIAVAQEVAQLTTQGKLVSVAGGGDTVAALNVAGVADDFSYLSLAGGAFLEWLEGKTLPGIQSLKIAK